MYYGLGVWGGGVLGTKVLASNCDPLRPGVAFPPRALRRTDYGLTNAGKNHPSDVLTHTHTHMYE